MQILTTGKNLDIGEALRKRIETRLAGNLAKYFDGTVRAHVVVELQKSTFKTECTLHLSTGLTLQAHGEEDQAYASFDMAAGRLEKQLRRYKRRLRDYHRPEERRAAAETGAEGPEPANEVLEETQENGLDDLPPAIIAESDAEISHMSVGEAVTQLDTSDLPFVVFRDRQHGAMNIVYRRRDGLVGWIGSGGAAKE